MKAPIEIARHIVAHLDDDDRNTLTEELTGKTQAHAPGRTMRMCKYCGGMIHGKGVGPRCVYCQRSCWTAAEGYDCKLTFEGTRGKESFNQIETQVEHSDDQPNTLDGNHNDAPVTVIKIRKKDTEAISDGGAAMEEMFDRLDGTLPDHNRKLDLAEILHKAKMIHPLLPSIMTLLADGTTQMEAARKLKVSQSVISEAIKSFRARCDL